MEEEKKWHEQQLNNKQLYAFKKLKKELLTSKTKCALCGLVAETLHHSKPRSEYESYQDYLEEKDLTPVCHLCHYFFYHANWGDLIQVCPFCTSSKFYKIKDLSYTSYKCRRCRKDFYQLEWYLPNKSKAIPIGVSFVLRKKIKDGSSVEWSKRTMKFNIELARRVIEKRR